MDGTIPLASGQAYAHHCVCDETTEHDGVTGYCTPETCEAGVGSEESEVASAFKKRVWMAGCGENIYVDALCPERFGVPSV